MERCEGRGDDVESRLVMLGLGEWIGVIEDKGYDDLDFILDLEPAELLDMGQAVGMKPGHAMKLQHMVPAYELPAP